MNQSKSERTARHRQEKVYFSDKLVKGGWFAIWRDIGGELYQMKELTWRMFLRDFKAMYQQSVLGYFWAVIVPLISVGLFVYLNQAGLFSVGHIEVPYTVYAVVGMAFWQLFAPGLVASGQSLVNAGSLIVKINFPRESLVFAAFGTGLVSFGIQLVLGLALMLGMGIPFRAGALLALPSAVPLVVLGLALGLVFALMNGVLRDIGNALTTVIPFLLFVTPILYQAPSTGIAHVVATFNPLYHLVRVPRDLLLFGTTTDLGAYFISAAAAVVLLIVAWQVFHLTETRITEKI